MALIIITRENSHRWRCRYMERSIAGHCWWQYSMIRTRAKRYGSGQVCCIIPVIRRYSLLKRLPYCPRCDTAFHAKYAGGDYYQRMCFLKFSAQNCHPVCGPTINVERPLRWKLRKDAITALIMDARYLDEDLYLMATYQASSSLVISKS